MIVVQANPKTQPGGLQGALFKLEYQSETGPSFINQLPMPSALKLSNKYKGMEKRFSKKKF